MNTIRIPEIECLYRVKNSNLVNRLLGSGNHESLQILALSVGMDVYAESEPDKILGPEAYWLGLTDESLPPLLRWYARANPPTFFVAPGWEILQVRSDHYTAGPFGTFNGGLGGILQQYEQLAHNVHLTSGVRKRQSSVDAGGVIALARACFSVSTPLLAQLYGKISPAELFDFVYRHDIWLDTNPVYRGMPTHIVARMLGFGLLADRLLAEPIPQS